MSFIQFISYSYFTFIYIRARSQQGTQLSFGKVELPFWFFKYLRFKNNLETLGAPPQILSKPPIEEKNIGYGPVYILCNLHHLSLDIINRIIF